jgi:acyl carrier protein
MPVVPREGALVTGSADVSLEEVRAVLIDFISDALQIATTELSTDRPLQDYGADSVVALSVFAALEHTFDCVDLPSTLVQDCQTIDALVPVLWNIIGSGQHDNSPGDAG